MIGSLLTGGVFRAPVEGKNQDVVVTIVHRLVAVDLLRVPAGSSAEQQRQRLKGLNAEPLGRDMWRLPDDWRAVADRRQARSIGPGPVVTRS